VGQRWDTLELVHGDPPGGAGFYALRRHGCGLLRGAL